MCWLFFSYMGTGIKRVAKEVDMDLVNQGKLTEEQGEKFKNLLKKKRDLKVREVHLPPRKEGEKTLDQMIKEKKDAEN